METSIYKPLASSSSRRIISELLFHFKELSLDDRYITALQDGFASGYYCICRTRRLGFQRFQIVIDQDFRTQLPSYDDETLMYSATKANYYLLTHY